MSLSRDVRKAIESGSASYAVVEANNNGYITVKVIGSDQRITNLEFIGAYEPEEGAKVILDYSAGQKPVVRPIEQEYVGIIPEYSMQDKWSESETDPGVLVGSVDVGMGCTVKAQGFYFPNEPHDPHDTWIQYWGYNTSAFLASIYDTMLIYGETVLVGQQYFNITLNGKYLLTFNTSLHLAGGGYSGDPYGTLTAFVYRVGAYGPFPIMVGTATAAGYNSYYNIDISKVMYLPAGDQICVELAYTGGVLGYALNHSTNPLKWLDSGNDLTFKIQLLAEAYVLEPPPEVSEYEGLARRLGQFGTVVEQGMDTSTKDLTDFALECTDVTETQNGLGYPISDNEFIYLACTDQVYGQYQLWKVDPDEGTAIYVEVADGSLIEAVNNKRIVLPDTGIVGYEWYQLFSWTGSADDTAMTVELRYMDWGAGDTESEISTLDSFDVAWAPPLTYGWNWGQQYYGGGFLTVGPFVNGFGQVATYNDKHYMICRAVDAYRTGSYVYYSRRMKWRFYDVDLGTYTDITTPIWTREDYGSIKDTGWFQYNDKLYTFVSRNNRAGAKNNISVHVIDLDTLALTIYDVTSQINGTYTALTYAWFDYVRGRMYSWEEGQGGVSGGGGERLIYYDVDAGSIGYVDDSEDGYNFAGNKYNVYGDDLTYTDQDYFNFASITQITEAGSESDYIHVCSQVSSDEDRVWVLDMTAGSRKLIGYHRSLPKRELSLENTAIGDLPDVIWNCSINLIGNAFIITLDHSTQGTHWYIVKPRI